MTNALHPIPDEALADHMAILGKTGSGKTVVAKTLAERILDRGERFCAVDPTGAWWGLRLMADGVTPSPYEIVIFGGRHADVPIGKGSAEKLAEIIGRGNVPSIVDTSLMTVGERTTFFAAFAGALFRENEGVLHLFIDEAHVFAPKGKVASPQAGMMLAATNELVSGGRSRGFRITMITQRPAKLHNDSLTQIESLVAMRLVAPHDRNAVDDWVKEHGDAKQGAEVKHTLAWLARGEGWVWAPELDLLARARFPMVKTFDSSAAPKPGDKLRKPRALQAREIAALRATLEAPATDVAPVKGAPALPPSARSLDEAYARGRRAGDAEGYERGLIEGEKRGHKAGQALGLMKAANAIKALRVEDVVVGVDLGAPGGDRTAYLHGPEAVMLPPGDAPSKIAARHEAVRATLSAGDDARAAVLKAMAELAALGFDDPPREFVAAMCGFGNIKSARIANAFATLASRGLISARGGTLTLTPTGAAKAPHIAAPSTPADMRARIVGVVGEPADKILGELTAAYPNTVPRQALAERVGFTNIKSARFAGAIAKLARMDFIDVSDGHVRASAKLFPAQRGRGS